MSSGSIRGALRRFVMSALAVTPILFSAGCGQSDSGRSLANLVLANGPQGSQPQPIGNDGTLSIDDAAAATPADPARVHAYLQSNGWRGAFARVWVSGANYAEDLGFVFSDAKQAQGLVEMEIAALKAGQGDYVYSITGVPGAQGFILYSQTRLGARNVFCNGSWFAHQAYAFELLTCGPNPGDDSEASRMTADQFRAVGGASASP